MTSDTFSMHSIRKPFSLKQEIMSGSLAGFSSCVFGHPFDTIKTIIQVHNLKAIPAIRMIYKSGGITKYYTGLMSQLASITIQNAFVFTSYEIFRMGFKQLFGVSVNDYRVIFFSGLFTGYLNSFVCTPMELLKIQKQIQVKNAKDVSYLSIINEIKASSGWSGLMKGLYLTNFRDSIGCASQFLAFKWVLDVFTGEDQTTKLKNWQFLLAGGFAGICGWFSCYPFDTIKSKYQSEKMEQRISFRFSSKSKTIIREIYQVSGIRGFYAGFLSILPRAFFSNAAKFYIWSFSKESQFNKH